uniref:7TM_GPCR_Srx domain-containing protein n=1 Tax=Panagrellus redivivus TaxID=6233 RepID=A0A7E4URZ8_PANRE
MARCRVRVIKWDSNQPNALLLVPRRYWKFVRVDRKIELYSARSNFTCAVFHLAIVVWISQTSNPAWLDLVCFEAFCCVFHALFGTFDAYLYQHSLGNRSFCTSHPVFRWFYGLQLLLGAVLVTLPWFFALESGIVEIILASWTTVINIGFCFAKKTRDLKRGVDMIQRGLDRYLYDC